MDFWEIVTFMATVVGSISLIPQVISALQNKHLEDISWEMLFLLFGSSSLWGIHGALTNEMPLVISASFNCTLQIVLLSLKRKYESKEYKKKSFEKTFSQSITATSKN